MRPGDSTIDPWSQYYGPVGPPQLITLFMLCSIRIHYPIFLVSVYFTYAVAVRSTVWACAYLWSWALHDVLAFVMEQLVPFQSLITILVSPKCGHLLVIRMLFTVVPDRIY